MSAANPADALDAVVAGLQRAAQPAFELFLVGGALRDALLHRLHCDPLRGLPDIDLLVQLRDPDAACATAEPAAHSLARRLMEQQGLAAVHCQFHHAYGTVELEWRGVWIDLATARREDYPLPAENPQVRPGRLQTDLARRDFSVNAMALPLHAWRSSHEHDWSALIDPHGGLRDLASRQLRVLHPASLCDDPTRVVRGARYAARLGFGLEPATLAQVRSTLQAWPWAWCHGDPAVKAPPALGTRLRMELQILLDCEPWPVALAHLQQWGALVLLDEGLQNDRAWPLRLRWAARIGVPLMPALLIAASDPLALAQRLQMPHRQQQLLQRCNQLLQRLGCQAASADWPTDAAEWVEQLESTAGAADVVKLALLVSARADVRFPVAPWRRPLLRWLLRWRCVSAPLSAQDLLAQGYSPGPALGEALKKARAERLALERS